MGINSSSPIASIIQGGSIIKLKMEEGHSQKMSRLWPIPQLACKEAKITSAMGLGNKWTRSFSC